MGVGHDSATTDDSGCREISHPLRFYVGVMEEKSEASVKKGETELGKALGCL